MRILILIIAHDEPEKYKAMQEQWRRYMRRYPEVITAFFLKSNPCLEDMIVNMETNTMTVPGEESWHPGILNKTLRGIHYAVQEGYDYLYRTNLSTFLDMRRLIEWIQNHPNVEYAGSYGALSTYASGSGFLLSRRACRILDETPRNEFPDVIDDVSIGNVLCSPKNNYPLTFVPRRDVIHPDEIILDAFQYRCKNDENHSMTIPIMKHLYQLIYHHAVEEEEDSLFFCNAPTT